MFSVTGLSPDKDSAPTYLGLRCVVKWMGTPAIAKSGDGSKRRCCPFALGDAGYRLPRLPGLELDVQVLPVCPHRWLVAGSAL